MKPAVHDLLRRALLPQLSKEAQDSLNEGLTSAEEHLKTESFAAACRILEELDRRYPENPNVEILLRKTRERMQGGDAVAFGGGNRVQETSVAADVRPKFPSERSAGAALPSARDLRELSDLVLYARRRVRNGDLDEARQLVSDARMRFPDATELLQIETEIEQAGALEHSLRSIRNALKERRFDEARKTAEPLLTASPANQAIRELLAEIKTQQDQYERQQTYDRGRAEAERLARALKFQAAIEKIEQLLSDFPADPALNEDLNRVTAARDLHTKREEYRRGQAEAQSLSDRGRLDEAIAIISRLLEDFPGDPALDSDLKAIQAAKLLRDERIRTDVLINELEILFRNGDAEGVRRGAKQPHLNRKEPRVAELLDWAEKSIAQAREIRGKRRRRGPLLIAGGIGVVAAAVLVAAIVGLPAQPTPITVQPEELAFSYAKGGNVPEPQSFQIKAGRPDQRWTTASSAPWLRFSKMTGMGTSDVDASVDPSSLSPGQYESVATIDSASVQKVLMVRLHITEPPVATPPPPQEVRIEPSQLEFSYLRTGPSPPSQRFRIITIPNGQGWTATGEGAWVVPSRRSGAGTSDIEVSVNPSRMTAGDYSSVVKLRSAASVKSLTVLLHVIEPERFDPTVNCRSDQYNGRYTGTITWLGPLKDGEVLTIGNKNVASPGRASGRELPGCPVSITTVPALDIQEPSAESNYRQIRFTNKSGHAIDSIKIIWKVK